MVNIYRSFIYNRNTCLQTWYTIYAWCPALVELVGHIAIVFQKPSPHQSPLLTFTHRPREWCPITKSTTNGRFYNSNLPNISICRFCQSFQYVHALSWLRFCHFTLLTLASYVGGVSWVMAPARGAILACSYSRPASRTCRSSSSVSKPPAEGIPQLARSWLPPDTHAWRYCLDDQWTGKAAGVSDLSPNVEIETWAFANSLFSVFH